MCNIVSDLLHAFHQIFDAGEHLVDLDCNGIKLVFALGYRYASGHGATHDFPRCFIHRCNTPEYAHTHPYATEYGEYQRYNCGANDQRKGVVE